MDVVAEDADPVRIQFLAVLLRDAGIEAVELDQNLAGLGLSIFPRRLAVKAEHASRARQLLRDSSV
jgi:hypothetical protein